ncbi:DUF3596 domain-containing protein [Psychrosphaera sp. 1_MG-2023]|uniref:Arm DNA-binding domain-containing protein n=1 Tax=Psychrosphaera sp. 1_MG-2023 TaxID=3062643 RepID=UPI0026E3A3DD|nr:DUF3596 domain-containing protein [Psychrosphaera sp. 1_MG-2023]MDO6718854.1 DUF3596 domain-containing protein [Psychrosphaera sp. 1_MG-2023]
MSTLKMTESLLEYCKSFEGVSIHGKNIRVSFYYRGVRCIESIKGVKITKSNIKFASNKRTAILHEIATNQFNYLSHFPESKRAALFSPGKVVPTVAQAIEKWLSTYEVSVRPKQFGLTKSRIDAYILPMFGHYKLDDLTQSKIRAWRDGQLTGSLGNKTINDVMSPLRAIFKDAMADRIIDFNPMDHIKNLKRTKPDEPDPFTQEEISRFKDQDTHYVSEKNGVLFAIYSGVRISEWMALSWDDVDLKRRKVTIRRSIVDGEYAYTKNDGSNRTIDLLDQAYEILLEQRAVTQRSKLCTVSVLKDDNRTKEDQSLRFVFLNTNTGNPFTRSNNFVTGFFRTYLEKCKIRFRPANQARHTYASQLLTMGIAERWIAKQMGHTSIAMLEKHYGKWMDSEVPDMATKISKMFSNGSNSDPKLQQGVVNN